MCSESGEPQDHAMSVLPSDWLTGCPVEQRGLGRQFSLGVWREHTHSDICDTDCS